MFEKGIVLDHLLVHIQLAKASHLNLFCIRISEAMVRSVCECFRASPCRRVHRHFRIEPSARPKLQHHPLSLCSLQLNNSTRRLAMTSVLPMHLTEEAGDDL